MMQPIATALDIVKFRLRNSSYMPFAQVIESYMYMTMFSISNTLGGQAIMHKSIGFHHLASSWHAIDLRMGSMSLKIDLLTWSSLSSTVSSYLAINNTSMGASHCTQLCEAFGAEPMQSAMPGTVLLHYTTVRVYDIR
jgi:hypothetical protein